MYKVALKDDEKALFTKKRGFRNVARVDGGKERSNQQGWRKQKWRPSQQGRARPGQRKDNWRESDRCYKCNQRGHFAREYRSRREEGNTASASQSPSGTAGYGNQGYGYGNYGGNDGSYVNPAGYGAVGGRSGGTPNSNAAGAGGGLQGTGSGYMGSGYGDANGNSGYGNAG
ncbi:hypothetical protein JCGZ_02372 [Jatropha curcas]|uniref:CCHC-type domain-containing protein n=1 Tax=Jatropha curcas TaxID=180498 RepID=A0A067L8D7_JATCU|nr:hypothetical protein JCGZ_02372 [Jatropha curcas]